MKLTSYKTKTPITIEIISDVMLIISQCIAGYAIFADNHVLAFISMTTGVIGKILSRFIEGKNEKLGNSNTSINGIDTRNESTG